MSEFKSFFDILPGLLSVPRRKIHCCGREEARGDRCKKSVKDPALDEARKFLLSGCVLLPSDKELEKILGLLYCKTENDVGITHKSFTAHLAFWKSEINSLRNELPSARETSPIQEPTPTSEPPSPIPSLCLSPGGFSDASDGPITPAHVPYPSRPRLIRSDAKSIPDDYQLSSGQSTPHSDSGYDAHLEKCDGLESEDAWFRNQRTQFKHLSQQQSSPCQSRQRRRHSIDSQLRLLRNHGTIATQRSFTDSDDPFIDDTLHAEHADDPTCGVAEPEGQARDDFLEKISAALQTVITESEIQYPIPQPPLVVTSSRDPTQHTSEAVGPPESHPVSAHLEDVSNGTVVETPELPGLVHPGNQKTAEDNDSQNTDGQNTCKDERQDAVPKTSSATRPVTEMSSREINKTFMRRARREVRRENTSRAMGYVYAMQDQNCKSQMLLKIGWAVDPSRRVKVLNKECPEIRLRLASNIQRDAIVRAQKAESLAHAFVADYQYPMQCPCGSKTHTGFKLGEYFMIDLATAQVVIDQMMLLADVLYCQDGSLVPFWNAALYKLDATVPPGIESVNERIKRFSTWFQNMKEEQTREKQQQEEEEREKIRQEREEREAREREAREREAREREAREREARERETRTWEDSLRLPSLAAGPQPIAA